MEREADAPVRARSTPHAGVAQGEQFRKLRIELDGLARPSVCDACQMSLRSWLDKHVAACDVMVEVGQSRDLTRLRATLGLLAEARVDLQRFNADVDLLVATIRRRTETARAGRAARRAGTRWPFGGAGSPARAG